MARILVVDDDASIRELVSAVLSLAEHEIVTAASGAEGLALLTSQPFDLMMLDIAMPDLCGYDVLELVRDDPARAAVPVIVISGRPDLEEGLRDAQAGTLDRVSKPFDIAELTAMVEHVLASTPSNRQQRAAMRARSAEVYGSLLDLCQSARTDQSA